MAWPKQEICKVFKANNLNITIKTNKEIVNFLDVTLDLTNRSFKPLMKPNNKILHVHRQSNHPPALLKNIPQNINKRLSCISSTQQVFNEAIPLYQKALDESGYSFKLTYDLPKNRTNTQNRTSPPHHMVEPSLEFASQNQLGKKIPLHREQKFPKKTSPSQDLQQTHFKTELLLYA